MLTHVHTDYSSARFLDHRNYQLTLVSIGRGGKGREETDQTCHFEFDNRLRDTDRFVTRSHLTFAPCIRNFVPFPMHVLGIVMLNLRLVEGGNITVVLIVY